MGLLVRKAHQHGLMCGWFDYKPVRLLTLYRAVNPIELADIRKVDIFRNLGFAEGKYFTNSMEAASSYAKQAVKGSGHLPYTIVQTRVSKKNFEVSSHATVDRGGVSSHTTNPTGERRNIGDPIPFWIIITE